MAAVRNFLMEVMETSGTCTIAWKERRVEQRLPIPAGPHTAGANICAHIKM